MFQFLDVDPGQQERPLGEGQPGKLKPALGTLLFPNALVEACNRAGTAGARGILVVLVCLTIETYGFTHSLYTFLACTAHGGRIEDDGRLENASRDICVL